MIEFLTIAYVIGFVFTFTDAVREPIEGVNPLSQWGVGLIISIGWPIYVLIGLLVRLFTHNTSNGT